MNGAIDGNEAGPRVFAITGAMGAGKSTVARLIEAEGVPVVDADQVARAVVLPGSVALREIVEAFGDACLTADGVLDRKALGRIVFGNAEARARLNAIVHPRVREEVARRVAEHGRQGARLVAYDIPLLFETKQQDRFRPVLVVVAPPEDCIARVMARDGLSREEAEERAASQIPLEQKRAGADVLVDNAGPHSDLAARVRAALHEVRAWQGG